jgi:predicted methyltransferase
MIERVSRAAQSSRIALLMTLGVALTLPALADPYDDAVAAAERPQTDRERDVRSRPSEVLRFFAAPTSGVVLDLFAGGGYYSEILSHLLADSGTVYMHNNRAYLGFAGEAVEERLKNDRLSNVVRYDREMDAIDLGDDSVDMILMVMTYHDLYFEADDWKMDPDSFFDTVHRLLRPGGVLAIVDHVATAGTGPSAAQELHRIDPAFARQDIEARGFTLVAESALLQNPDDPLTASVFDPSIRGHTSRFLYKFIEPRD